jgi:uncharacterized membrane protein YfcA
MPVLAWLGLPATMANATNNLATTAQSLFSSASFARHGFRDNRLLAILAAPALLGAILGSWLVTAMSDRLFSRIVGVLMLFTLVIVLRKRQRPGTPARERRAQLGAARTLGGVLLFAALGVYGGFFGGGIGLVMLPLLVLIYDLDFVTGNSVKTGLSFVMNVTAAVVFAAHGLIHLVYAAPLTAGMLLGAQVGVRMSIRGGDRWIRALLVVITVIAAAYFLLVK